MLAVLSDQPESATLLLENGADVLAQGQDGGTALHAAAPFGRARCVELLLQHGADPGERNGYGQTAEETMAAHWGTTQFIASLIRLPIVREDVEAGRARAQEHFRMHGNAASSAAASDPASPPKDEVAKKGTGLNVLTFLLSRISLFHHLWFLWFLCWLVAAFAVYAWVAQATGWKGCPDGMILSPARFLWLIPLTMIPQWFMGQGIAIFGPDTSSGLLPMPHVLGYYAIFFGFGALYYESDDTTVRYTWIGKMLNGPRQRRRTTALNSVAAARPFGVRKPPALS